MANLIAGFIGQTMGLAGLAYLLAVVGTKHPTVSKPLHGLKGKLFLIILGMSVIGVILQRLAQDLPGQNGDIWMFAVTVVCTVAGRKVKSVLLQRKFAQI